MTSIHFTGGDPLRVEESPEQVAEAFETGGVAKLTAARQEKGEVYVNTATVAYWQEAKAGSWRALD